ncbi:hypothetical protein FRC00_009107 [Tulasnella sp. 408]|nr:hypothetical protein FRC00_009107 [Tulasnella sp. 408]
MSMCMEERGDDAPTIQLYYSKLTYTSSRCLSQTVHSFQPEYGRHQIESTPGAPYNGSLNDLVTVEENMRTRRDLIRQHTVTKNIHHIPSTVATYPRIGVSSDFTDPVEEPTARDGSILFPEAGLASVHPRYLAVADAIKSRRGGPPCVNIPIFRDLNTMRPFEDPMAYPKYREALPDHIFLDAVGFGPSSCSLQVTMQASDIDEARILYDALVPIAPIMLALSAASPIFKGYLADIDSRWEVLRLTCDDRTPGERGEEPLKQGERLLPDSRWFPVKRYISPDQREFNDEALPYDEQVHNRLVDAVRRPATEDDAKPPGMDDILAKHFASLYVHDPVVVFEDRLHQDDATSNEHFECIQSTVWQTLRFKPPPPGSNIGWRVELRTMEVQLTDFENAAFAVFVVLLSRAMLKFGNTENMSRAQKRDAVREQKFWFSCGVHGEGGIEEMSLDQIVNGKASFIHKYLDSLPDEDDSALERQTIEKYLELIKRKANGSVKTTATWIRDFVRSHPEYKYDSVVTQTINYDLLKAVDEM